MIPLYRTYSDAADADAVAQVVRSGLHWAEGPAIEAFEAALGEYVGVPGVLACNSGTSALHMALAACNVNWHHEVIVPSFTFIATVNAVRCVGATPVFADIEPDTLGLDPEDVERRITPNTRAIVAVHYAGQPCRIGDLKALVLKHRLVLIEDACEALGAQTLQRQVGTFGDCSVFSFCANKVISTGEGGALVTSDKRIYDRARLLRSHGRAEGTVEDGRAERYVALGYNWRMSTMQAALGLSQLQKIDRLIAMRRAAAMAYGDGLHGVGVTVPLLLNHVCQLYTVRVGAQRDHVMQALQAAGIGCKVYFRPVHLSDYYRMGQWQPQSLPVTECISSQVLSLPMFPGLTEAEVHQVCEVVKGAL